MTPPRLQPLRGTFAGGVSKRDHRVYDIPDLPDAVCKVAGVMPDMWHNAGHSAAAIADTTAAKALCATCPEIEGCLEYAIVHDIREGIFGGLTAAERKQLRRDGELS
jgi:WhiB family redox-sensing transcriptional regulator